MKIKNKRFNILLFILSLLLSYFIFFKTPIFAYISYNDGIKLYDSGDYAQAVKYFERALSVSPNYSPARYYYVLALSKSEPTYSVQKKLYEMGQSEIVDEASTYAKSLIYPIRKRLLEGIEDNYIEFAPSGNDILRWDINSFPLGVYIENPESVPAYYTDNIKKAMSQWESRTNFVKFNIVNSKDDAKIYIRFAPVPENSCPDGKCKYTIAYTQPSIIGNRTLKRMDLTFYKTNPRGQDYSAREVYNTALHELGHTLGIMGHSDNKSDIMYASNENTKDDYAMFRSDFQSLTFRDLRTLALLYRIAPTISDTKNIKSESFYYAPIILGDESARAEKKIEELQKYIRNYPDFAAGYINISSVYNDIGEFKLALEYLVKAQTKVLSQDDLYLINFNRAVIYFNMQDLKNSYNYALKAKEIRDTPNVNELISAIEQIRR